MADVFVPVRAGSDIASLAESSTTFLSTEKYFRDRSALHRTRPRSSVRIPGRRTSSAALFSGFDPTPDV